MNVLLMGHFKETYDEGVRIATRYIAETLKNKEISLKMVNITSINEWKKARTFKPDIIHFFLTPTLRGLFVAQLVSFFFPGAKTVISALHPSIPNSRILKIFRFDLVLTQSEESEKLFRLLGFQTKFLPNGVDVNRFRPVDLKVKEKLRKKYKIPQDKFVVLHLASLKNERNLDSLIKLQNDDGNIVLIVGRENEKVDLEILRKLKKAGCKVWLKHFQNIEDIYNLADCYVFPTMNKSACIETPLSVLEAMACNLPVVTTRFGALPRMFEEGDGLFFADDEKGILRKVTIVKKTSLTVRTRDKIMEYSWDKVGSRLLEIYKALEGDKG